MYYCAILMSLQTLTAAQPKSVEQYERLLQAHYFSASGNPQAQPLFEELISEHPEPKLFAALGKLLFTKQKHHEVIGLVKAHDLAYDRELGHYYALSLQAVDKQAEAENHQLALVQKYPGSSEIAFAAVRVLIKRGDYRAALLHLDNLHKHKPDVMHHALYHFLAAHCHLELKDFKKADYHSQRVQHLQPNFEQGWLLSGLVAESQGRTHEALQSYKRFSDLTPHDPVIGQKIIQMQVIENQKLAGTLFKAFESYKRKEYKNAQSILQSVAHPYRDLDWHLLFIDCALALNNVHQICTVLNQKIANDPQEELWLSLAHLLCLSYPEQPSYKKILYDAGFGVKKEKQLLYAFDMALRCDQRSYALHFGRAALKLPLKPEVESKVIYQLALLYYEKQSNRKIKELLKDQILAKSSYAPLLNFAAYYFAKKHQLDKAQEYCTKALSLEPDNPHYLDTQACIYYKQRDYEKARMMLAGAIKTVPHDAVIAKHYAKTLFKLGRSTQAIKVLSQAIDLETQPGKKQKYQQLLTFWGSR